MKAQDRRRSEIAKIHILAKQRAGMDDHTYRAFLIRETGKSSAAELDQAQRGKVLDALKAAGFVEGNSHIAKLADFDEPEPQTKLIRCLWSDLKSLGALTDSSDKALRAFIKRTAKVDSIKWLGIYEASLVIEGLKAWKRREQERKKAAQA